MIIPRDIDLNLLPVFAAVAELSSFTGAAERLGVAKAKVSLDIARLEQRLGLSLFTRTTRRVALTDAGRELHQRCGPLLGDLRDALARSHASESAVAGTLRISCSIDLASQSVAAAVARFALLHPALQIDLRASDHVVDLVGEGVDLALRVGWMRDSSLRSARLGHFEQRLVASPEYLRRAGVPRTPQELSRHDWIALSLLPTPLTWRFESPRGGRASVRMRSRLRTDSPTALRALLEAGAGLSVLDGHSAGQLIGTGRLVPLLTSWSLPRGGVYAVFPPGKHLAINARAFVAFFREVAPAGLVAAGRPSGATSV